MISAAELAHHLGGRKSGRGWTCRCPVPGHRDRNPSFSISEGDDGRVLFHCFVCDQDQVVDALRARGLLNGHNVDLDRRRYDHGRIEYRDRNPDTLALVNSIWNEATNPAGAAAEQYLRSRKLTLPLELRTAVLRIHPACVWENGTVPCLIAAFRSIKDDSLTAIHRIRLDQPERWPKAERKMLGTVTGSAIKLDPVSDHLVIGEGLETCMAARQLGLRPVWALGSASGIENLSPVRGVQKLIILGENDGGPNRRAAMRCCEAWRQHQVLLYAPRLGFKDFNDVLAGQRHAFT
jgi:Toprim domain